MEAGRSHLRVLVVYMVCRVEDVLEHLQLPDPLQQQQNHYIHHPHPLRAPVQLHRLAVVPIANNPELPDEPHAIVPGVKQAPEDSRRQHRVLHGQIHRAVQVRYCERAERRADETQGTEVPFRSDLETSGPNQETQWKVYLS